MAATGENPVDTEAHVQSYSSFIWMMKWGAVVCLIAALLVVLIIS